MLCLRDEWSSPGGTAAPHSHAHPQNTIRPIMASPRELATPRLTLRPFGPGDVDDIFEYARDTEWAEYLLDTVTPAVHPMGRGALRRRPDARDEDPSPSWAIVLDDVGIGGVILSIDSKHKTGAIHYALARTHWGQGLMTEAVAAVVDWGFRQRGTGQDLVSRRPAQPEVLEGDGEAGHGA